MGRMRKTFVALVSLYIGLASGFIVPSGSPELLHENSTNLYDLKAKFNYTKLKENITNTDIGKNLINNDNLGINHQNQMALYEFVTEKENNVNERSLIVLNQKFRTPLLNKLYNPKLMAYFTPSHNEDKSPPSNYGFIQILQKPFKFENSYFQPNLNREFPKLRNPEGYFVPHKHACSEDAKINRFYNLEQQKAMLRSANRGPKEEFVQLLKPPIVRPVDDHKPSSYLNNNKDFKQLVIENKNNNTLMQTPADIKTNFRSRYNFLEPLSKAFLDEYGQRIYAKNIITSENIKSNEDVERLLEQKSEEDKIDTLIKDVLEEKSLQSNSHLYSKNCDHRECFRYTGKQYSDHISEGQLKSTCQCLIKNNLIQRERKDLTPFPTKEAKIEDTIMDEFIKLLRT